MTDLDARIALTVYYRSQGLAYSAIARLLRVDASSISRYIKQAEDRSWAKRTVRMQLPPDMLQIVRKSMRSPGLEDSLREAFADDARSALRPEGVIVVRTDKVIPGDEDAQQDRNFVRRLLAIEGSGLLTDVLSQRAGPNRTTLGIAWGRSTGAVVSQLKEIALPEVPNLEAVPLQGGMGQVADDAHGQFYPDVLAHELSALFKASRPAQSLSLPAYIDPDLAQELGEAGLNTIWRFFEKDLSYRRLREAYADLDVGLIGVGGLEPGAWATGSGYLPNADLVKELRNEGAIGDIACRFYRDAVEDPIEQEDGLDTPCIHLTNRRAIGISLTQLRERVAAGARIIAVAGSESGAKGPAVRAAIRNGFVSDVVTDDRTARSMLGETD